MNPWEHDPAFADLKILAQKLEAAMNATNDALLRAAGVQGDALVDAFAALQVRLLRLDTHGERRFREALEEKRVKTLAQGNIFMSCVMTSAVALSEFKSQPRQAAGGRLARGLERLKDRSTNPVSLSAFALTCFYSLLGKGAIGHLGALNKARKSLVSKG